MCIVWSKLERIIDILTGPSHTQTKTSVFDLRSVWPTGYQEASMKQGTPCRCFPLNDGEKGNRDTVNSPGLHHNHCNYSRDCAKSKQINEAYQLFFITSGHRTGYLPSSLYQIKPRNRSNSHRVLHAVSL